jgi:hypothetical protein
MPYVIIALSLLVFNVYNAFKSFNIFDDLLKRHDVNNNLVTWMKMTYVLNVITAAAVGAAIQDRISR